MKYKLGTLEEYLVENPVVVGEPSHVKKWRNPKKDNEYLWKSLLGNIDEEEKFDIVSIWGSQIVKPKTIKYYINKNGEHSSGIVEVGGVMQSGLNNLEIYNDKDEWESRVKELGIEREEYGGLL